MSTSPQPASDSLRVEFGRFEAALAREDADTVLASFVNLFLGSMWLGEQYGVVLKQGYQEMGQDAELGEVVRSRRSDMAERGMSEETNTARLWFRSLTCNVAHYEAGRDLAPTATPLATTIPRFQLGLIDLALRFDLDVCTALASALRVPSTWLNPLFGCAPHSPFRSPAVREFMPVRGESYCPFAMNARLWGAEEFDDTLSLRTNVLRSVDALASFTRAARREVLDGFVFSFPAEVFGTDMPALGRLLRTVVGTLAESDPVAPRPVDRRDIVRPGWRFSFAGEDFFVPVFAPLYGPHHPRYTYGVDGTVFVLLQPDSSFHSRLGRNKKAVRHQIKRKFDEGMQGYDSSEQIEAHRFLPALHPGAEPEPWYDAAVIP